MHRTTVVLISILMALTFNGVLPGERTVLADPPLSGAEAVQVTNGDFSGVGLGIVGTPPANYDFEAAGGAVGAPPTNHNFSSGDFTGWVPNGSPTIESGGPGGSYAQLSSGQKITSSAFTGRPARPSLNVQRSRRFIRHLSVEGDDLARDKLRQPRLEVFHSLHDGLYQLDHPIVRHCTEGWRTREG
jgi:hypothetical protein